MKNKGVSLAILVAFLVFSWSCVSYKVKTVIWQDLWEGKEREATIDKIQTNSGEIIDLLSAEPATMTQDGIIGSLRIKGFQIEKTQVRDIRKTDISWFQGRTAYKLTTFDGKTYRLLSYKEKKGVLICDALVPYTIPYADVDRIWIKVVNVPVTVFLNALFGGIIILYAIWSNEPPYAIW